MKPEWVAATALVIILSVGSSVILARRRMYGAAEVAALALGLYAFFVLLMCGMASDVVLYPGVPEGDTAKPLILATAGGLVAQLVLWLTRVSARSSGPRRVRQIYAGFFSGALGGIIAAALLAVRRPNFSDLADHQAGLAGVAGGALGVGILELVKRWFGNGQARA